MKFRISDSASRLSVVKASPLPTESPTSPATARSTLYRLFSVTRIGVQLILVGHLLVCVAILLLMPGGWPLVSVQTLGYRLLPGVVGAVVVAVLAWPRARSSDGLVLAFFTAAWATLGLGSLILFDVSGRRIAAGAFACCCVLVLALLTRRKESAQRWPRLVVVMLLGVPAAIPPLSLLASPPSSTRPLNISLESDPLGDPQRRNIRIDDHLALDTSGATLTLLAGRHVAYIEPLLSFNQRSPDGCWTIFAPRVARRAMLRELRSTRQPSETSIDAEYLDTGELRRGEYGEERIEHQLRIAKSGPAAYEVLATSSLSERIFSHLNTFTQITVAGHRKLAIRFSPVPEVLVELKHHGYPVGEPSRFAYVNRDQIFHVVEASNAEKGPFRELGAGRLQGPLTMTLVDGEEAFMEVQMDDWATQASVELSPTAGWGVPQNAIQFSLLDRDPRSPATIFISLASTSVGRGWNSVAHSAGVYRNRMSVVVPERSR